MDISAISAALSSASTIKDMVKGAISVRDAELLRGKLGELHDQMIKAQIQAFAIVNDNLAMQKRVTELEQKLVGFETWATEKQRYELQQVGAGAVAYAQKASVENPEPVHYLCANCFQEGKKRFLQQMNFPAGAFGQRPHIHICAECDAKVAF